MTAQTLLQRLGTLTQANANGDSKLAAIFHRNWPPLFGIVLFLVLWHVAAAGVKTSLGELPGPAAVWEQTQNLYQEHIAEREREAAFYERQEKRKERFLAENPGKEFTPLPYTGKPTYLDQIFTSLYTVFAGFTMATLVAVPLGILCGLSKSFQNAINPLIQIFRPVSRLAWLPIVTLVVSAVYVTSGTPIQSVCSVVGVPCSLKLIFTGLRLSLGVGWMVLIAAEMLAQNPGLGKFVWDEFQNGSSQSLGRIMVAVFTIGFVGFLLDRIMQTFQQLVSFGERSS
ncbi:MAG: ABC transporter permease [Methylocaldum sp.]|nr:ABC transporter permease [Methylocaldum sp.]